MSDTQIITHPGSQQLVAIMTIHAPREAVFKAVTDPLLVPEWMGSGRLSTTVHRMIVMPGGSFRYLQRDQDGNEYGFHGVYHEVLIPERLVYTMEYEGNPGHVSLIIDTFEEVQGSTIMTSKTIFQSVEDLDQMLEWGMEEGITQTAVRLNKLLANDSSPMRKEDRMTHTEGNGRSITITRVFNAPIEHVWRRWTNPEEYKCWWGPKDFTAPYARFDLRPGGKYLYSMRGPDGKDVWGTGIYKEIIEPNRIVYTDSFADEHGNVVPSSYYGMDSEMPMEMEVEVQLEDIGGKTRLTLEHCGLPEGEMLEMTREGWNQSFDKLAECLE